MRRDERELGEETRVTREKPARARDLFRESACAKTAREEVREGAGSPSIAAARCDRRRRARAAVAEEEKGDKGSESNRGEADFRRKGEKGSPARGRGSVERRRGSREPERMV